MGLATNVNNVFALLRLMVVRFTMTELVTIMTIAIMITKFRTNLSVFGHSLVVVYCLKTLMICIVLNADEVI